MPTGAKPFRGSAGDGLSAGSLIRSSVRSGALWHRGRGRLRPERIDFLDESRDLSLAIAHVEGGDPPVAAHDHQVGNGVDVVLTADDPVLIADECQSRTVQGALDRPEGVTALPPVHGEYHQLVAG